MAQVIKKPDVGSMPAARSVDPFAAMRAEMDRVFDNFLGRGFSRFPSLWWEQAGDAIVPSIDIRESASEVVVEAEMPGLEQKDASITLREGVLTLEGEKKSAREEKEEDYHVTERSYGTFRRSFRLPDTIDENNVSATFDKGILTIKLAKKAEAVRAEKRIEIKSG